MTPHRHGSAVTEYPSDLEIVTTRAFDAPIDLVFDVLTKPEHVNHWFAPFDHTMTVCAIDLRVGGKYHLAFVTDDGTECSFRGTYLEIERPTRSSTPGCSRVGRTRRRSRRSSFGSRTE